MFMSTANVPSESSKTLLMGIHGAGKTTQAKYMQAAFGPGFIISGEGGLRSLQNVNIPYLPFTSWDGKHEPQNNVYSFRGIVGMISSGTIDVTKYRWMMVDSLVELTDRLYEYLQQNPKDWAKNPDKPNPLEMWGVYGEKGIGALKWIRDLPLHVCVTSLLKEDVDDNNRPTYWPMVKGSTLSRQIPGIFDFVFGLQKYTEGPEDNIQVKHRIVTNEVNGWKCKARDPRSRLKPIENTDNFVELIKRVDMTDAEYDTFIKIKQQLQK